MYYYFHTFFQMVLTAGSRMFEAVQTAFHMLIHPYFWASERMSDVAKAYVKAAALFVIMGGLSGWALTVVGTADTVADPYAWVGRLILVGFFAALTSTFAVVSIMIVVEAREKARTHHTHLHLVKYEADH